jgi:simple sugar transport system ATP-binding protein
VSHRLHEIKRIADRVFVIRDGKVSATLEKPFDVKQIVTAMVGAVKERGARESVDAGAPILEIKGLVAKAGKKPLDLVVNRGEVLGITGLIGAGKSELAETLFGLREPLAGRILLEGKEAHFTSNRDAIEAGIHLVPEDRNTNAIVNNFSIRDNITFPFLRIFSVLGLMKRRKERQRATELVDSIGVKCSGEGAPIESLSGGNQQKVVVARWLVKPSKVLILDEPFQGVDIKSRHDIGEYIRANAREGAVIVMATDLDEIIEVADRIVVFNDSKIAGEQSIDGLDRDLLLHWSSQSPEEIA